MLDTFENDMILSAVQQLTTEVQRVEGKANKIPINPEIPIPAAEDAGKVIGVDEEGNYALVEGGSGETNTKTTISGTFNTFKNDLVTALAPYSPDDFTNIDAVIENGDISVLIYINMTRLQAALGSYTFMLTVPSLAANKILGSACRYSNGLNGLDMELTPIAGPDATFTYHVYQAGEEVDVSLYPQYIDYQVTIYEHKMPDEPDDEPIAD